MILLKKPLTYQEYKTIYSKVPRITAEVLLITEQGILLTYRNIQPHKDEWHIPGGTIYFKESPENAVKRVAKEELGIDVTVEKLIGYIEYPDEDKAGGFDYPIGLAFICKTKDEKVIVNDQASEAKFFKTLPQNMVKEQKEFLQKHFNF